MSVKNNRSLLRGLSVIEALADHHGGMGPTEIAGVTGVDKGTVLRLLYTLVEAAYVRRDPQTRRYALTARILHIAQGVQAQTDLRHLARPHLLRLRDEVNETVHLGVLDHDTIVYVEKLQPPNQSVQLVTGVGQTMPVHSTALGKAILSRMGLGEVRSIMDRISFTPVTPNTIVTADAFLAALEVVRERGFALDEEENMEGVSCVAAPIVGVEGEVIGAVSISSPTFRVRDRLLTLGASLRGVTRDISADLGGDA